MKYFADSVRVNSGRRFDSGSDILSGDGNSSRKTYAKNLRDGFCLQFPFFPGGPV